MEQTLLECSLAEEQEERVQAATCTERLGDVQPSQISAGRGRVQGHGKRQRKGKYGDQGGLTLAKVFAVFGIR